MTVTDAHRRVYDLLTRHYQNGLSRDELARLSGLPDRTMRRVIEELRTLAANGSMGEPAVIGYDPQTGKYAAAQSREQAERITAYYRSYVHPMLEALRAQERAIDHYRREAEQGALFDAPKKLDTRYVR